MNIVILPELQYYKTENLRCKKDLEAPYNKFESLDGQRLENKDVEEFNKTFGKDHLKEISSWTTIFEIGLLTAVIANSLDALIFYCSQWQYDILRQILRHLKISPTDLNNYIAVTIVQTFFLIIVTIFVITIAPLAGGGGLGFLRIYLNGINLPDLLNFKTMIIKMFGIIVVVISGLVSSYRETVVYYGAVIAKYLCKSKYINLNLKNYFDCERDTRDFILAGIATGTAAAFHCMFCGILLSIELCASIINHENVMRVLGATCMGYVVLHIYDQIFDITNIITISQLPNFKAIQEATHFYEVFLYFLLAIIVGVFGGLWTFICNSIFKIERKTIHLNKFGMVVEVIVVYWLTRVSEVFLYEAMGDCDEKISRIYCRSGSTETGSIITWSTISAYTKWCTIITDPLGAFDVKFQIYLFLHVFGFSALCQHLKLPVGRILILLILGAMLGRIYAELLLMWFHWEFLNSTLYALMGSAAMIGSAQYFNMSYTILILENFNCHVKFTVPIAASNLIGAGVAKYFFTDFYSIYVKNIPFLSYKPPDRIAKLKGKHIMATPVVCFKTKEKADYIYHTLKDCCHNGFPVVDHVRDNNRSNGRFRGMITRNQLIELFLKFKAEERDTKEVVTPLGQRFWRRQSSNNTTDEPDDINLFYEMNHFTFRITSDYPITKIFSTFLALALRHMPVVDYTNRVIGIITRKDFLIPKPYDFKKDELEKDFWM